MAEHNCLNPESQSVFSSGIPYLFYSNHMPFMFLIFSALDDIPSKPLATYFYY